MSSDRDALFAAILANPDEDTPRLVYADWLEENGEAERAEFIRVQIELARLSEGDPRRAPLMEREGGLLQSHQEEWLGLPALEHSWPTFRRGFVAEISDNGRTSMVEDFPSFDRFPTCETLHLRLYEGDEEFRLMPELPNLRRMWVHSEVQGLSDAVLPLIARYRKLETLQFDGSEFTNDGLKHLAGLTSLRTLDLHYCQPITDDGLQHLAALTALEDLDLSDIELTGRGLDALRALPRLRRLNLEGTRIREFGLGNLVGVPALEHLRISDGEVADVVGDEFLTPLAHLTTLRVLSLPGHRLWYIPGAASFRALQQLTRLESLCLRGPSQGDDGLSALCHLPRLKRLSYSSQHLTPAGLHSLARVPELSALQLRNANISDESLECCSSLTALRWLDLSGNPITDEGLRHLAALPVLNTLILDNTQVTGSGLRQLRPLNLRNFSTSGTGITYHEAMDQRMEWAPNLQGLSCAWDNPDGSRSSASIGGTWQDWHAADE